MMQYISGGIEPEEEGKSGEEGEKKSYGHEDLDREQDRIETR